jgi:hypothetical protein
MLDGITAPVSELQLTVTATNGIPNAHVMEMRVYDKIGLTPFPSITQRFVANERQAVANH